MKKLLLTLIIVLTSLSIYSQDINPQEPIIEVTTRYTIYNHPDNDNRFKQEYAFFAIDKLTMFDKKTLKKKYDIYLVTGVDAKGKEITSGIFNSFSEAILFTQQDFSSRGYDDKRTYIYVEEYKK